jgi:hypothetical protein
LAWKSARNDKLVGSGAQVVEHSGAVGIVCSECPHVVPYRQAREAGREDFLLVGHDLDGADGRDSVQQVGKYSAAASGE